MAKESKRQKQVSEIIKRHFSLLLQQEGPNIYGSETLVTVTNVKLSPDLNLAKVYLSIYNTENKQAVIMLMQEHKYRLQQEAYHRLRKQLRRVPELSYYLDETLDEMYRLNELFGGLNKKED